MSLSSAFQIANTLALVGWCFLIIVPRWKQTSLLVFNFIVILFAVAYFGIIATNINNWNPDSYSTLENVSALFGNKNMLLAGWIHYLAFDLIIGLMLTEHSLKHKGNSLLLIICQLLTFMFGPIGFLVYYINNMIKQKTAAPQLLEIKE
ncbi:ABA4-like family protein [Solitalea sp. MAHUQ-68]|uniref:ABA4-like family protein n=1 Tax=Solitalea agri TaxID=2953739 RepID=A0A9X2FA83_9SPHI|nr:ABA4-like family protein [Solitalea agri]MCO4293233.1 ABA4-like family protein [Solitalea agri]